MGRRLKKLSLGFAGAIVLLNVHVSFAEPSSQQVHTRSLAASCAACHGTQGNSVGSALKLAGLDSTYFITQMQAFKSGARKATVMHRHAIGLTHDEIVNLANYFANQIPVNAALIQSQTLDKNHQ